MSISKDLKRRNNKTVRVSRKESQTMRAYNVTLRKRFTGGGGTIKQKEGHTKAFFTFGRFQPPTSGHSSLVHAVADAASAYGGDAYVFATSSINKPSYIKGKKHLEMVATGRYESCKDNQNPLKVDQKVYFLEKMNPGLGVEFIDTTENGCTTITEVVDKLREAGYTEINLLVGSDRIPVFERILGDAENIKVMGAGSERVMSGDNNGTIKSVSGTKVREAAIAGDLAKMERYTKIGDMTKDDVLLLTNVIRQALCFPPLKVKHNNRNANMQNNGRNNGYSSNMNTSA